jgi:hypothetical protein
VDVLRQPGHRLVGAQLLLPVRAVQRPSARACGIRIVNYMFHMFPVSSILSASHEEHRDSFAWHLCMGRWPRIALHHCADRASLSDGQKALVDIGAGAAMWQQSWSWTKA